MVSGKFTIFCLLIALSAAAWDGTCSDKCWDCTGPTDADCTYCADHASKNYDEIPRCVCDPHWYGDGCKYYEAQPYATPAGDCDPKCMGGCTGPTSSDCVRCVETAHLDQFGACVCDSFYGGIACNMPIDQRCDARCYGGCDGFTNYDCVVCVNNAYRTTYGACICKPHYTGLGCEDYIEYDECHPICGDGGCSGPGADDCVECVANAHKNYHGCCECDNFWYGDDCSVWMGSCDDKCLNSCTGPTAADCDCCVANATEDDGGACACNEGYGGEACALYLGACDPICYGCHGPDAENCDYCVNNATKNEYGQCHCDWQWQGAACDQFVYQGVCDPICDKDYGCTGPKSSDCDQCNFHSFRDNFGNCQCEAYWSGVDCGTYVYTGHCHTLCDGSCFGPDATDCVQCVPHSHRDSNQTCVCDTYWTGDDCSVRLYMEACHPVCDQRYGCAGSSREDCVVCNDYSERDFEGHCQCKEGFHGNDCNSYDGPCHPMCGRNVDSFGYLQGNDCNGPTSCDCYQCGDHSTADPDFDGCCKCDKFWEGPTCDIYNAPCHPICLGCYGRSACDCEECVEHAHKDNDTCVCDDGWGGEDCSIYEGQCHPNCMAPDHCHGPEDCDCDYCADHAQFDDRNYCVCIKNWTGLGCTEYTGPCHPVCDTCHGPNAMDCLTCVENAEFGKTNECSCSLNWSGLDCSEWIGDCDIRCDGCSGPNPCDCDSCVANAHFDQDGLCECDQEWSGYSCTEYQGFCDERCIRCFGPSNLDCEGCVRNAHRGEFGACECDADWRDEDCSVYAGQCHPKCESGCFGPTDADCEECICHSHRDEHHRCVCNEFWTGPDCSQYMGPCDATCHGCNGPFENSTYPKDVGICDECVDNAHRDEAGRCICDAGWLTEPDCSVYSGPCYKNCANAAGDNDPRGCYGPTEYDCFDCIEHAHRSVDGICTCDEDWGDSDDGAACSAYTGVCDHRCANGCHGPTNADCEECVENASGQPCECNDGWDGDNCQYYNLKCDARCDGCTDGSNSDCTRCVENAERNADGDCICKPGIWEQWHSDDQCNKFIDCDPMCAWSGGWWDEDDARTCTGPGRGFCKMCVVNSHRNWEGQCECDDGWTGADCSDYDGECDCKCAYSCHGPTAYDCNSCVENAIRDNDAENTLDQECVCAQWWTGDDCSIYRGPCASTCHGCSGPDADQCEDCVENAYYEADGTCRCRDEWMGSDCTHKRADCHETCDICLTPNLNECIVCKSGYTLVNGYCVPCDSSCATCSASNGTGFNQCTSCYTRFGILELDEAGWCHPCHPSCKTCSRFLDADACTSCHDDSTLSTSGHCLCDFPKVRLASSQTCENYCPSGTTFNPTIRTCEDGTVHGGDFLEPQIYFTLETKTPIFNSLSSDNYETVNSFYVDGCNPPVALGSGRGSYFNGLDSSLNFYNFQANATHAIELWTKVEVGGGSLAVMDAYFFYGMEFAFSPPDNCLPYDEPQNFLGKLDFWISDCYTPVLTVHNDTFPFPTMSGPSTRIERGWTKLGYAIQGTGEGSQVTIYENDDEIWWDYMEQVVFKAIGDGIETSLGSFSGASYFLQGFMFDFKYTAQSLNTLNPFRGFQKNLYGLFSTETDLESYNDCDWNQFIDHDGDCEECDATCTNGCTSGDVCYECHSTCRTCTGHSTDDCVDCFCGAEVDADGCCSCNADEGFEPEGSKCKQTACFTEGCNACLKGKCIHCEYGYHMTMAGTCEKCREQDCDDIYDEGLDNCQEKGIRRDTGICDCDDGGSSKDSADESTCRICSKGCARCVIRFGHPVCEQCEPHYIAIEDMPHLCIFENHEYVFPMGYEFDYFNNAMFSTDEYLELFNFNLSDSWETLSEPDTRRFPTGGDQDDGLDGGDFDFEDPQIVLSPNGRALYASWSPRLSIPNDRTASINHATRGMWFDGKYDRLEMVDVALPPRMNIYFWIKAYHDGTLFSVSALHDEANQHLVMGGIRGKRLESSVEYGDDLYHPDTKNQVYVEESIGGLENSGFVPEGSVHQNSPFIPMKRYSKTDMDVVNIQTWQNVGFGFDYNSQVDTYQFKYFVNDELVDTSYSAHLTNIYHDSAIYPTKVLFGAQEVDDALSNMYRGFIYNIVADNGLFEAPSSGLDGFVLGECEWDEFLNEAGLCEHCPYWCREGCYDDGSCPVPTHNPWP